MHFGFRKRVWRSVSVVVTSILFCTTVRAQSTEAPPTSHFRKVVLEDQVTDAMALDVAVDGRVFWIERQGPIRVWDPDTKRSHLAGSLPSLMIIEDGALGIALDPDFLENGWLYVYYAPATGGPNRLSRFTYRDDQVDLASEKVLLEVPVQRNYCCHSAGQVLFDSDGLLWLSTGDNTHNVDPRGAPLNEEPGFEFGDAQRSAANTNDLRGKILRIRPLPDGTYEIPEGNLFPPGTPKTRPEIYTMGHRNPWRFSVDPKTGWLFWGDVGLGSPADPERGPNGWEEFNVAKGPGFYGWPYFAGPNEAYRDYDYATETSGAAFDPARPINDSPNNTGVRELPPAQPALIWYFYSQSEEFPELGTGGMSAAAGPVYRRPETAGPYALPAYYEGAFLAFEWMRNWIKAIRLDDVGNIVKIEDFLPGMEFSRPTDIQIGPDGALYVIEWGTDFWGSNPDAKIVRIEYHGTEGEWAQAAPEEQDDPAAGALSFEHPLDGGFFEYGQPISYALSGEGEAEIHVYTGHDTHMHPVEKRSDRKGMVTVDREDHMHHPDLHLWDRFVVLEARSGKHATRVKLHPRRFDAEFTTERTAARRSLGGHPAGKGYAETAIIALEGENGQWAAYDPVNLAGIHSLTFRVKPLAQSTIELRLDGEDGKLLGTVVLDSVSASAIKPVEPPQKKLFNEIFDQAMAHESAYVPDPSVYEGWYEVTVPVQDPGGKHSLYLVFRGEDGKALAQVDWIHFNSAGVIGSNGRQTR